MPEIRGVADEDTAALEMLLEIVGDNDIAYIYQRPRVPIDARPCALPGSLKVTAVLLDGSTIDVFQASKWGKPRRV